jgi:nucleotide-binding universal stress UspA family protein
MALIWACQYANLTGAVLVVLHVVHDPGDAPGYYRRGEEDALRPMEDVAREMLEEFLERAREDHPEVAAVAKMDTRLVRGIPATRILEAVESVGAGLIVMGSRGRTGLPRTCCSAPRPSVWCSCRRSR